MIDFIPITLYRSLFFYFLFVIVVFTWLKSQRINLTSTHNLSRKNVLGFFLFVIITLYIGLRPVSSYFGDMGTYSNIFQNYQNGGIMLFQQDVGFDYFMSFSSKVMTIDFFFLLCAFLYVFPLYLASKILFEKYSFYSFLILVISFSFWSFGTNGIRNGIATSIMLLALTYRDKKWITVVLMLIAVSFHKSMLLPIGAYIITIFYKDSKKIFYFWLLCIPISLVAGSFFETIFGGLSVDDRISYLTAGNVNNDDFSSIGFRWDFLIYSASAVYSGWYFIFKRNYRDLVYSQLFNVYMIVNGFWILVIRANFSNRFAYLSWFMMGVVIIYPFLKKQFFKKQHKVLGTVILLYFMFTFVMNVILS